MGLALRVQSVGPSSRSNRYGRLIQASEITVLDCPQYPHSRGLDSSRGYAAPELLLYDRNDFPQRGVLKHLSYPAREISVQRMMLYYFPVLISEHPVKLAQIPCRTTGAFSAAAKKEAVLEWELRFRILM